MAKLYDINPELVEDRGFLDMLRVGGPGGGGYNRQQCRRRARTPERWRRPMGQLGAEAECGCIAGGWEAGADQSFAGIRMCPGMAGQRLTKT